MDGLTLRLEYPEPSGGQARTAGFEGLVKCPEPGCQGFMREVVRPGRHAARWVNNRLVNCVGREIA